MSQVPEKLEGVFTQLARFWARVTPWDVPPDRLPDRLAEFTSDRCGREAAVVGLDWLGSLFEEDPGLVNRCFKGADCARSVDKMIFKAEAPQDMLTRLQERARFRLATRRADDSFAELARWLRSASTHRMLFPTYHTPDYGWLIWAEVTIGPAPGPFPQGWRLAEWSFHVPKMEGTDSWGQLQKDVGQLAEGQSVVVSFQPLRASDFDFNQKRPEEAWAAASLLVSPIPIEGCSPGLALALAAQAAEKKWTLRRAIATGVVGKSFITDRITGEEKKARAVRTFWQLKGRASFFLFPGVNETKIRRELEEQAPNRRLLPIGSLNDDRVRAVLSDGFDDYRQFRVDRVELTPTETSVNSLLPPSAEQFDCLLCRLAVEPAVGCLLRPIVPHFNDEPEPVAMSIFKAIETALLSPLATTDKPAQRWEALSRLPDEYVVVLCKLTDLEKGMESLESKLVNIVQEQMKGQQTLDLPTAKHFEQKIRDGRLALVVYPEASLEFLMRPETESQLRDLKKRLPETSGNRVILVCPDAHLHWTYDRLKADSK